MNESKDYKNEKYLVVTVGDNDFYSKVDTLLSGGYEKRISDAVKRESETFNNFIKLLGVADDQKK